MVIHNRDHKVQLNVRAGHSGGCLKERSTLCKGRGQHARACAPPFLDRRRQPRRTGKANAKVIGIVGLVVEREIKVIL